MKFIKPSNNLWHTVVGEDGPMVTLTPRAHSLLSLAQWRSVRSTWPQGLAVGVEFPNDTDIEELVDDLPRLALVVLRFPKWTDGRAYSQAHLLRSRYRYKGEVRAIGEVVVDMMPLLKRTGFDSVVLRADQSIDIAERALHFFPGHYQGDVDERRPLFARPPAEAHTEEAFNQAGSSI
jgi:uncharacterized protein (DUF934 family)